VPVALLAVGLVLSGCNRGPADRVHSPRCSRGATNALEVSEDTTRDHTGERCNVILTNTDQREIVIERGRLLHHPIAGAVGADNSWQGFVRLTIAPGKRHRMGKACSDGKYLVVAAFEDDLFDADTGDGTSCLEEFEALSFELREGLCTGDEKLERARSDKAQDYNCMR
jgi:hypothetical protein